MVRTRRGTVMRMMRMMRTPHGTAAASGVAPRTSSALFVKRLAVGSSISSTSPHVRPTRVHRTRGGPGEGQSKKRHARMGVQSTAPCDRYDSAADLLSSREASRRYSNNTFVHHGLDRDRDRDRSLGLDLDLDLDRSLDLDLDRMTFPPGAADESLAPDPGYAARTRTVEHTVRVGEFRDYICSSTRKRWPTRVHHACRWANAIGVGAADCCWSLLLLDGQLQRCWCCRRTWGCCT